MSMELATYSGAQRAALLLLQIGKDNASSVLSRMPPEEMQQVVEEIIKLEDAPETASQAVLAEFYRDVRSTKIDARGGEDMARAMLEASGIDADKVFNNISNAGVAKSFQFLKDIENRQLQNYLIDEHPQTIALVMAHLRADQATMVLAGLESDLRSEVAHRLALMESASPDYIRAVAEGLQRRATTAFVKEESAQVGGVKPLVDILNRADSATEKSVLEGLTERDEKLAETIRGQMFVFEDMVQLDDRAIQLVLRSVDTGLLAKALKGASEQVTNKILRNVSSRARQGIEEEIELMGRMKMSEVEEARVEVVGVVRDLEAQGQVELKTNDEDEYVS